MKAEFELSSDLALVGIERIVIGHAFDQAGDDWSEVERTYEDKYNYVSFLLSTDPGERSPCVRVELGVHDETARRGTGGLKAEWDRELGKIVGVQAIVLEGEYCPPGAFLSRLESLLSQVTHMNPIFP